MNVYSVKQWARYLAHVSLDLGRVAGAILTWIAKVPARARVHSADKHEIRRIVNRHLRSTYRNAPVLKRLAQYFQGISLKLGKLIEEENAVVSK